MLQSRSTFNTYKSTFGGNSGNHINNGYWFIHNSAVKLYLATPKRVQSLALSIQQFVPVPKGSRVNPPMASYLLISQAWLKLTKLDNFYLIEPNWSKSRTRARPLFIYPYDATSRTTLKEILISGGDCSVD